MEIYNIIGKYTRRKQYTIQQDINNIMEKNKSILYIVFTAM